jgi:DNA mismatch repair ATPase MutS
MPYEAWKELKERHGMLLLIRDGDRWYTYDEDAVEAAQLLNMRLQRDDADVLTVSFLVADEAEARLALRGRRVAWAEPA